MNVKYELASDIDNYLRDAEQNFDTANCLARHEITPYIRSRMVDWIIEVLTNFHCDDQTFFITMSLMDRYFKNCRDVKEISHLHITGVTCMFIASKFEDINPLRMKTVDEKISQKKIPIENIKALEMEVLKVVKYKIHAPTSLDFLKQFLLEVLGIQILNTTETKKKQEFALNFNKISRSNND